MCVTGVGAAGLATGRVLQDNGLDATVFDEEDQLGGARSANRTGPGLHTKSPRECYGFSDHPYPATADGLPAAPQVRAYLGSYAQRFVLHRPAAAVHAGGAADPRAGTRRGSPGVCGERAGRRRQRRAGNAAFRFCGGRVDTRGARSEAFTGSHELTLDTGEAVGADLVMCTTGDRQSLDFLAPERRALARTDEGSTLYRHILPPGEARMCFSGFGASISNQLIAEVSAHWIAQLFRGELTLPDVPAMRAEIARVRERIGRIMPARTEGYFSGGFAAHHADDPLRDMGLLTMRTGNFLAEHFERFWADRFADLGAQRRQVRDGKGPVRQGFYVSAWHTAALVAALAAGAYAVLWRRNPHRPRRGRQSNQE